MSKSKAEEARKFLDDLDNLQTGTPPPASTGSKTSAGTTANADDPADVLKFIDEITQKSSEPRRTVDRPASRASIVTPTGTIKKATERVRVGSPAPSSAGSTTASQKAEASPQAATAGTSAKDASAEGTTKGAWGWGNVWSSASAALQQAREVVDERVKHLPNQEYAAKLREQAMGYVPKNLNRDELERLSG